LGTPRRRRGFLGFPSGFEPPKSTARSSHMTMSYSEGWCCSSILQPGNAASQRRDLLHLLRFLCPSRLNPLQATSAPLDSNIHRAHVTSNIRQRKLRTDQHQRKETKRLTPHLSACALAPTTAYSLARKKCLTVASSACLTAGGIEGALGREALRGRGIVGEEREAGAGRRELFMDSEWICEEWGSWTGWCVAWSRTSCDRTGDEMDVAAKKGPDRCRNEES
jgi:hypothetical protein